MKYKEKYINREIEFEAIDDYTYEWGMSETEESLREYLGLSEEEEDIWVSIGEEELEDLLESQRVSSK